MSKSGEMYYQHQREFGNIEHAEMMHDIEQAEYLNMINDERYTKKHKRND
jgi:hypothetical protein